MSYKQDSDSYVASPINIKPPPFPTDATSTSSNKRCSSNDLLSTCKDLSIAKSSLKVANQVFKDLKHEDISAKGLEVTKYGEDMLEEIQKLLSKSSRSKETNDQSCELENDENKANLRFKKFIEESPDFQYFVDRLWNINLLIDNEINDAINKLRVAIKHWKSKQGGWNLIRSKTFSFVKFLSISRRRFDDKFKINENDLSEGEIVIGSKKHISQRIYRKYTRVAEKTVDNCDDDELKKEIKYMQELEYSNLTSDNKLLIARGIANALDYCHEKNILHGDIRTLEEIKRTILDGNRPELTSEDGEYQKIIKKSWSQDPSSRDTMKSILEHLNKLINSSGKDANDDFDSTDHIDLSNYGILRRNSHIRSSQYSISYKDIERGIDFHKHKKYKDALDIFQNCYDSQQNDPNANFWLGFYYIKGFGVKNDGKKGMMYLKKASELQHPEAQYWYALTLLNTPVPFEGDRYKTAMEYLRKSARQYNPFALEKLGKIVQKGLYYQKAEPIIGKQMIEQANKLKMEINF
ncbi:10503_t:CDS:2 [Racocetra fulgida]|uniref:10503_t:CDS:1 n=1 Tax=Racocetra fulgida TaxID=60492 RepID=A0A9N8W194_9GLOM|nr:10503_t:CDS:2 [Racocetra fulgida]